MARLEFRSSLRFPALVALLSIPVGGRLLFLGTLPHRVPVAGDPVVLLGCAVAALLGLGLLLVPLLGCYCAGGQVLVLEPTHLSYRHWGRELKLDWGGLDVVWPVARPWESFVLLDDAQQCVRIQRVYFPEYVTIARLIERKLRDTRQATMRV